MKLHRWNILLPAALLAACPATTPDPTTTFDRKALLAQVGEHAVLATYRTFQTRAQALRDATRAYADSFTGGEGDAAKREAAQAAWRAAMATWQEAEVMQVGPAGLMESTTGGKGLRDAIYSWPVTNPCRVDQETASKNYEAPNFFATSLVPSYGLDALEYLLFRADAGNACAPQATVNQGTWQALTETEIAQRRAAYGAAVAGYLVLSANELVAAWDQGGYLAAFANAGGAGSDFDGVQEAVDELFAGMFYVDLKTKDMKLGDPSGITAKCTTPPCAEFLESRWAGHTKENAAGNLRGLRRLLLGNEPGEEPRTGFDDYLAASGAQALSTKLLADVDAAIAAVEAIPGTLEAGIASDPQSVRAAYDAVKTVTDTLKSQFVTVLNLGVPQEGGADND